MTPLPALIVVDRPHSDLGPSSFERAESCTASTLPSGRLARSSQDADEGTCAHALFEAALSNGEEPWMWLNHDVTTPEGRVLGTVTMDMVESVTEMVDAVREMLLPDSLRVEQKLAMPDSRMYGYADVIGVAKSDGRLVIADLKYGAGIWVPADTVQLGFYGLMTILSYGINLYELPRDAVIVRSVILQPRAGRDPIRTFDWTAEALIRIWKRLESVEHQIAAEDYRYKAGQHCRWCDRASLCPQLTLMVRDAALATVTRDPESPGEISELEAAVDLLPAVEKWIKAVRESMTAYVEAGGTLRNARLVKGRNSRIWADPDAAIEIMRRYGVDPFTKPEVISVAQSEKHLPKSAKAEITPFVQTVSGKPKIAIGDEPGEDAAPVPADMAEAMQRAADTALATNLLARHKDSQ